MAINSAVVVTQIPWAAVITGMAGLVGALGGSILTNRFAEKRWDKQVKIELEKDSKKLIREKGELTFLALAKWSKEIYFFYSARLGFLQGSISEDQLDQVIREKVSPATHGEVDVLIRLYFPDFKSDIEVIFNQLSECNRIFGLSESGGLTKEKALDAMTPWVISVEKAMEDITEKFCESLSASIR